MDTPALSPSARSLWRDASLSALAAGFVAVLVGFTSSVAIVFQAATALGATQAQLTSWMWALGLGMGLCTLVPAWWLRKPVMVAWSTPGAAVLAAGAVAGEGFTMAQGIGAFVFCGALILLMGVTGLFERVMNRLPLALAAALLAGVLARFGLQAFSAAGTEPLMVGLMLLAFLLGRRFLPRYAVILVLAVGVTWCLGMGQMHVESVQWTLATPVFTAPEFSAAAIVSLGVPLFIVTMASQNLPGVAAIREAGYTMPISKLMSLTGAATVMLAPFGAFALNLSAITAAICMGREAHEDPDRRYVAAMASGAIYVVVGLFGGAVAGLLVAFPKAFIAAIAGLALLGTIGASLTMALQQESEREPALITFLVTLSGVSILGVGSAFWGVVAGLLALAVLRMSRRISA